MNKKEVMLKSIKDAKLLSNEFQKPEYNDISVDFQVGRYIVDAKSVMGVLSCGIDNVATVVLHSNNPELIKKFNNSLKLWNVC